MFSIREILVERMVIDLMQCVMQIHQAKVGRVFRLVIIGSGRIRVVLQV